MSRQAWGHKVGLLDPAAKPRPLKDPFWKPLEEALEAHWESCKPLNPERPAPVLLLFRNSLEQIAAARKRFPNSRLVCVSLRVPGKAPIDDLPHFRIPNEAALLRHHVATLIDLQWQRHQLDQWETDQSFKECIYLPTLDKYAANWLISQEALRRSNHKLEPAALLLGITRQALSQYLSRHNALEVQQKLETWREKRAKKLKETAQRRKKDKNK